MLIPQHVSAIGLAASKERGRYQLSGVLLEREGDRQCRATATDGKIIASTTWTEPDWNDFPFIGDVPCSRPSEKFSAIVPAASLATAEKGIPKKAYKGILRHVALDEPSANGSVRLTTTDIENQASTDVRCCEGTYPNYKAVLSLEGPITTIRIRLDILKKAIDMLAKLQSGQTVAHDCVRIEFSDVKSLIHFRMDGETPCRDKLQHDVAVMPMVIAVSA